MGLDVSLTVLPALATFSPIGLLCSALMGGLLPWLIVFYFIVFGCCLLEGCSFLKGNGGEVEGEETVVGIYYMRKKIFLILKTKEVPHYFI